MMMGRLLRSGPGRPAPSLLGVGALAALDEDVAAAERHGRSAAAELLDDLVAAVADGDRVAVADAGALQVAVEVVDREGVAAAVEAGVEDAVDVALHRRLAGEGRSRGVAVHLEGEPAALPAVALDDVLDLVTADAGAVDEERVALDPRLRVLDGEAEVALAVDVVGGVRDPAAAGGAAGAAADDHLERADVDAARPVRVRRIDPDLDRIRVVRGGDGRCGGRVPAAVGERVDGRLDGARVLLDRELDPGEGEVAEAAAEPRHIGGDVDRGGPPGP